MNKKIMFLLSIVFSISFLSGISVRANGVDKGIKIDGKIDETIWETAEEYSGFKYLKARKEQGQPKAQTKFRIIKGEEAVYFGIYCEEPYMDKIKGNILPRDSSFWEVDSVEIFIDVEGRGVNYYQFAITFSNSQYDSYWIEGGNTQGGDYSAIWDSAVYKGDKFWSIEVRIPLSAFYKTPSTNFSSTWGINITRNRFPEVELTTWSDLERGFHQPDKFNKIKGMLVKSKEYDIEFQGADVFIYDKKGNEYLGNIEIKLINDNATEKDKEIEVYEKDKLIGSKTVKIKDGKNNIEIEDVKFDTLDKKQLKILVKEENKVLLGAITEVKVEREILKVEITRPFYANCIFPGQTIDNIEGVVIVNLPEEKIKNTGLTITFSGEGVNEEIKIKSKKERVFKFKANTLKEGDYTLNLKLEENKTPIAEKEIKIRKLSKPEKSSYGYIDENLNLVVNGTPVYVRGWYGGSVYLVSQALRNKYGNKPNSQYVNCWECSLGMESERLHQVSGEELEKMGITKEELNKIAKEEAIRIKQDVEPDPLVYKMMEVRIERNRDNPDFYWYYLCDEPECRGVSPVYLKYQYDFIKKLDPYHPVMIITRAPSKYVNCADILNPHPYLNPYVDDSGKRKMGTGMKFIRDVIKEVCTSSNYRIPAWCTPQAFSYGFHDKFADYPNFDEFNCMIWTAVVNGAKGFTPFIYYDHFNSVDLRLGADFIYETLSYLEEFLFEYPTSEKVEVENPGNMVDVMIKKKGDKILLIAVNLLDRATEGTIKSPVLEKIKTLYGYREERVENVKDGQLTLSFSPYEVIILTNPKMGEGLKTFGELKKEIANIKDGFAKKGNILYGKGHQIEYNTSDTYISNLSLITLTNGITDCYGWGSWAKPTSEKTPSFVEMKFLTFVPKFKRVKIYSSTIEDMELHIWKGGEWLKIGEVKNNQNDVIEFDFEKPFSTVKMKIIITKCHPGTKAEIYEVEMYEN